MPEMYFITHPEVVVDSEVPVPEWELSEHGHKRIRYLLRHPWIDDLSAVYSSEERKSLSAAEAVARYVGVSHISMKELGEVDRSSSGFLETAEHDRAVAHLFDEPLISYRGWEPAARAQERIVRSVKLIDAQEDEGSCIAIVSHGGVGTLLMCHVKGVPISREEAGHGQGNYFCFDRGTWTLVHGWRPIDHEQRREEAPESDLGEA